MREFARRITLARGLSLYREHKAWFADVWVGGKRMRYSLGTDQFPAALLALMQSQSVVWPEGTPIAGQPLIKAVRLWVDGKQVAPTSGAQMMADFVAAVATQNMPAPPVPDVTLAQARKDFLAHKDGESITESWRENLGRQTLKFMEWARTQGVETLQAATPQVLSRYRTHLRADLKLRDDSVKQKLSILSQMFAWSVKPMGWLVANPVEGLIEEVQRGDVIVYQPDEALAILKAAQARDPRWESIVALALYGGLRREEIIARLHWEELDKEAGTLRVRNQSDERTKGRRSRVVPLFDEIVGPLERFGWEDSGLIFRAWTDLRSVSRGVSGICEEAGVTAGDRDGLQYLRHTAASSWVKLGIPAVDAKRWLGHKEDQMTFERHYCGRLLKALPINWKGHLIGRDHVPPV